MRRFSGSIDLPTFGKTSGVLQTLFVSLIAIATAAPAFGQWHIDMYLGAPFMRSEDIVVKSERSNAAGLFGDLDDEGEVSVGGRVGYWWSLNAPVDLGAFVDASATFAELGSADFNFVPISALLMARLRMLPESQYPQGRLHPYVGIGPSLVWHEVDLGLFEDNDTEFTFDVRAGLDYMLVGGLAVFGEYRYTTFDAEYTDALFGLGATANLEFDAVAHQANFGFSWEF